jgi:metal-sulfur cluster biosynthetic enzyme
MPDTAEPRTADEPAQATGGEQSGADAAGAPTLDEVVEVLRRVEDPELRMSVFDLGLIYDVDVTADGFVTVSHTLTSPGCPVGPMIQGQIYHLLTQMPGVVDVEVNLVWDPPWDPRTMASEEVKLALGIW